MDIVFGFIIEILEIVFLNIEGTLNISEEIVAIMLIKNKIKVVFEKITLLEIIILENNVYNVLFIIKKEDNL